MKERILKAGLFILCLAILPAAIAVAEEPEFRFELSPYAGWNSFNNDVDEAVGWGLRFGYNFNNAWTAELEGNLTPTDNSASTVDIDVSNLRGSALYNFRREGRRWTPYLKAGLGSMRVEVDTAGGANETDFAVHGGGGLRWQPFSSWERLALRLEGLGVFGGDTDSVELSAGLSWFLGKKAAPAPPPSMPAAPEPAPRPAPEPAPLPPAPKVEDKPVEAPRKAAELVLVGQAVVLEGVFFDSDKSNIDEQDAAVLDKWVEFLKDHPEAVIRIDGHTDSQNSEAYNQALSERRAEAVMGYLRFKGIDTARMSTQGFGESKPRDTNDTAAGRARNRRVEVTRLK